MFFKFKKYNKNLENRLFQGFYKTQMSKNVEIFLLTNQKYGSIIKLHFHIFYNLIQKNF